MNGKKYKAYGNEKSNTKIMMERRDAKKGIKGSKMVEVKERKIIHDEERRYNTEKMREG